MATVTNVDLEVQKGGSGQRRRVSVTYTVCFSSCELLAETVFVEEVTLWGDDLLFDDQQATLLRRCFKAEERCMERSVRRLVSRSTLDEDGDTVIFGIPIIADRDELYARVTLTPFTPGSASGRSANVYGQWGAAGND